MGDGGATTRSYSQFVSGKWSGSAVDDQIERRNPANGEVVARFARGREQDVDAAVGAAREAFDDGPWPHLPGASRSRVLQRFGSLVADSAERLARIEVEEVGKPIRQARQGIAGCLTLIEHAAALARTIHGTSGTDFGPQLTTIVAREPAGVVAAIVPWNFPALLYAQKVPFALAAGCTVVVKPSEFTASSAFELTLLAEEAGVPPGVINVLTGYGHEAGQSLVQHPGVDRVSFTGSTATGRAVLAASSKNFARVSLELGGKGANVVFPDADLAAVVEGVLLSVYLNQGECCSAGSRLLVHESVADQVVEQVIARARSLVVGDPMSDRTDIGAVVHEKHLDSVLVQLERAVEDGAHPALPGGRLSGDVYSRGCFLSPSVFDHVPSSARIFNEEVFGPVLSTTRFSTEDEAIRLCNATSYGLANAIWTSDTDRALRLWRYVRSGTVWINTTMEAPAELPFGGYGNSGFGKEMGDAGLDEFLNLKTVQIRTGDRVPYFVDHS